MSKVILSNIVKQEKLREVQQRTLQTLADSVFLTAGPYGQNCILLHDKTFNEYSKDGHKVLSNIKFYDPLEHSIQEEIVELTRHVVKKVGDGTTTCVKLSSIIFNALCDYQRRNPDVPTFQVIKAFKDVVDMIKGEIKNNSREVTVDDIYKICMISTNGNEDISKNISDIYKEYGFDVFIDVGISNTTENVVKIYDGLTLERGFPSPAYVNTKKGVVSIRNPRIYCFRDPIDTPEMVSFFEKILFENIMSHMNDQMFVPTVIMAPSISRDVAPALEELELLLYKYDQQNAALNKPPILIITGLNKEIDQYADITKLCGCKAINKYIDPELQKKAIEDGDAPDIDTIIDWYGECDLIETDISKTKFINPKHMFDENDSSKYSSLYEGMLGYFESELQSAIDNSEDISTIGSLRRRLNTLKANMVDYLIGGVSVSDRDAVRDLVEDAVLNCRSACRNGVGYGANFEGYTASDIVESILFSETNEGEDADINLHFEMSKLILDSYEELITELYSTAMSEDNARVEIVNSLSNMNKPINLRTMTYNDEDDVLCTIDSDIVILDAISKIITLMFTANQAMLVNPLNNKYISRDEDE